MAEIAIKDEEAQRILAQAVKGLIEKHTEYFLSAKGYDVTNLITSMVKSAIEKVAREQIEEMLKDKKILDKVKEQLITEFTDDKLEELIRKITIRVGSF